MSRSRAALTCMQHHSPSVSPVKHDAQLEKRARTWSFASDMRGVTTTVNARGWHKGGSWKQSDLPPPVGRIRRTSLPCKSCSGYPQLLTFDWNLTGTSDYGASRFPQVCSTCRVAVTASSCRGLKPCTPQCFPKTAFMDSADGI